MNAKRKVMASETKITGNNCKASKIAETKKKALTKNELLVKLKALEEAHENLVIENDKNLHIIEMLQQQLAPTVSRDQECQTKAEYVEIPCTECIFLASSEDELNYHMGEDHNKDFISYFDTDFPCSVCDRWCKSEKELRRHMEIHHCKRSKECNFCESEDKDKDQTQEKETENVEEHKNTNFKKSIKCDLCEKVYKNKHELMIHKKKEHLDSVSECWNFSAGFCEWDNNCWFKHSEDMEKMRKEFKCTVCDKIFQTKMNFMEHRRSAHPSLTAKCKNIDYGYCDYGVNCWFRHTDEIMNNKEDNENNDGSNNPENVMQRVFKLMEEMTIRMTRLENMK